MKDPRYTLIKERLESCSTTELQRILEDVDIICWDTYNFDFETNTYCPIAVALNLHNELADPTDKLVQQKIAERFNPPNILKGVPGKFYTTNRREDLIRLCKEILLTKDAT